VSWSCAVDDGRHAFCKHDCCGDDPACASAEPLGARGSLAHIEPWVEPDYHWSLRVLFAVIGGPIAPPYSRARAEWEARVIRIREQKSAIAHEKVRAARQAAKRTFTIVSGLPDGPSGLGQGQTRPAQVSA
jgi:hypothetical protein